MKKLEWLAIVVIVLLISSKFLSFFGTSLISRLYGPEYAGVLTTNIKLIVTIRSLISIMVNLAIGIWLFIQARQSNNVPWIWLLFGLIYGLIAAVLFYILRIYESQRPESA